MLVFNLNPQDQKEIFGLKNEAQNSYQFAKKNNFFKELLEKNTQAEDDPNKICILPRYKFLDIGIENFQGILIFCLQCLEIDFNRDLFSRSTKIIGKPIFDKKIRDLDDEDKEILTELFDSCYPNELTSHQIQEQQYGSIRPTNPPYHLKQANLVHPEKPPNPLFSLA